MKRAGAHELIAGLTLDPIFGPVIVFGAVQARTAAKYGSRAERYVHIEVGHSAENLFLQAEDLGLGTCDVGAFDDEAVARAAHLPRGVVPILFMPVGKPR